MGVTFPCAFFACFGLIFSTSFPSPSYEANNENDLTGLRDLVTAYFPHSWKARQSILLLPRSIHTNRPFFFLETSDLVAMGVPALFRWLSNKYPKIVSAVIEEQPTIVDDEEIPVDATKPNPNGQETDNLYLDMNGIVHPCTHPEGKPPPANEAEMMVEVFRYTDRVVKMARPRKLLMIAVDGVAPRAKMNQQRSRRFRSAQDAKEADEKKQEFQKLLAKQSHGKSEVLLEEGVKKTWDSNVITPGTPFMDILAASLQYWVKYKLNTDPAWQNVCHLLFSLSFFFSTFCALLRQSICPASSL